jgi:hypothetical protein
VRRRGGAEAKPESRKAGKPESVKPERSRLWST